MNRNVTASFSLSVSLVLLFAVLLYQPDGPVAVPLQAAPVARAEALEPIPDPNEERPRLTPGVPLTESPAGDGERDRPSPSPTALVEPVVASAESGPSRSGPPEGTRPAGTVTGTVLPHVLFTHARPGESLADIATRVYGSPDSARRIWMANRDIIDSADTIPTQKKRGHAASGPLNGEEAAHPLIIFRRVWPDGQVEVDTGLELGREAMPFPQEGEPPLVQESPSCTWSRSCGRSIKKCEAKSRIFRNVFRVCNLARILDGWPQERNSGILWTTTNFWQSEKKL